MWAGDPALLYGRRISSISYAPADQPLTPDQLALSLQLRPGDTLEETALGQAIERLWATGRFEDISVSAVPDGDRAALTFHTRPAFFVSRITVTGVDDPPNAAQLSNAAKLSLGEAFSDDLLPRAADSMQTLLRSNGFYTARVVYETAARPATAEMDIRLIVQPGPRARFSQPSFSGSLQLPEARLLHLTNYLRWFGLRGYRDVTANRLQRGVERIRDAYLKSDHLQASVRISSLDYDAAAITLRPNFDINAGPRVFVRTEGAKLSRGVLRRSIPIYQERTVDRELLIEGQHNLEALFEAQGYFEIKVSYTLSSPTPEGEQTIRYSIQRGPRHRLVHVSLSGNKYFDRNTVLERLSIIPARFPRYRQGRFSQDLLAQDRAAILDLYRSNGFRDADVRSRILRQFRGKPTDIAVALSVSEGRQWFVSDVELTGVDLRLLDTIHALLASTPNQPYAVATVAADRDSVLNWYFNNGYPDATFDATVQPDEKTGRVRLRYSIVEGRRTFVRQVLVSGLKATRPDLVTRRLAVAPGQPLSQSSIVETQRRLYDLGIFTKVDVAVQNPEGRERDKYVLLQVDEARKYSLNLGFGAEVGRIGGGGNTLDAPAGNTGFAPRGLIGITRTNIFGLGHTANTTLRVSNIQQRLITSYIAPQLGGNPDRSLSFSSLVDRSRDVRTYTSNRVESSAQLGRKLGRGLEFQFRTTSRFVFIDQNSLRIDPKNIPVYSQPVKTIVASASFVQDRRDDQLDSHRGYYNTIDFGYAPAFARTSTNYSRLVTRNSTYHPIGRELTFARTTSFGWLHNLDSSPVPLPENFYAGGASTHRGFPDNQAGPRDLVTGFPIGGTSFLFFQHELRFPLIGTNVGAVLFHDMGNVFSSLDQLSFRYRQRNQSDFNYMVQAGGIGFRIKTPVGPIRVDLAYAPNTPRFVGFSGTLDDLINGRGQHNVPQRVSRFEWHFSIGQAF